jgi:hypothetical protein
MRLSSGRKLWMFIAINLGEDVNNTAPVSPKLIFIPLHMLNGCDFWTRIVQLLKHGLAFQFLWLPWIIELLCFSLSSPTYNFSGKTIIVPFPFWSFLQQAWCSTTLQWCSQYSILSTPHVMYKRDHQQSLDSHPEQVLWSPFELSRACRSWKVLFQHILLSCPFLLLYSYFVPLKLFFFNFKFITLYGRSGLLIHYYPCRGSARRFLWRLSGLEISSQKLLVPAFTYNFLRPS